MIELTDPVLDEKDPYTKMFLLAEYWKREALKAREELDLYKRQASAKVYVPTELQLRTKSA